MKSVYCLSESFKAYKNNLKSKKKQYTIIQESYIEMQL